jgi:putative endonuclease
MATQVMFGGCARARTKQERYRAGAGQKAGPMFYTYMLASGRNGALYIGSTDNIAKRVWQHRERLRPGFTSRYGVTHLVWYESHDTRGGAFRRERRIKEWRRSWTLMLIEEDDPTWRDLYESPNC